MTGFFEDSALRLAGLTDQDIATLNARLPDLMNLITVIETHQAQANRVLTDLLPLLRKVIAKQQQLGT